MKHEIAGNNTVLKTLSGGDDENSRNVILAYLG